MSLSCAEVRDLAPAFVLGGLGAPVEADVREHLATCVEPHPEFADLGGVTPYLLDVPEPIAPRPALRDRVMASFAAETAAAGATLGAPAPRAAADRPAPLVRTRSARRPWLFERPRLGWLVAAAAVVAVLALGLGNVLLQTQLSASQSYADRLNAALALAATPGARVAVMGPASGASGGAAPGGAGLAVLPAAGNGVLVMHDLSPTHGSEVYEAWLIVGASARPVGGFSVGSDGRGWLEGIDTAGATSTAAPVVVGLTREPAPGATKPTLPMVAAGNAQTPSGQ